MHPLVETGFLEWIMATLMCIVLTRKGVSPIWGIAGLALEEVMGLALEDLWGLALELPPGLALQCPK